MSKRQAKPTLVVVSAHPDDICCCGGLAAKYVKEGHGVWQLSVTLGETVRPPGPQQEEIRRLRRVEGEQICKILGVKAEFLDVPCNKIIPTMDMTGIAKRVKLQPKLPVRE